MCVINQEMKFCSKGHRARFQILICEPQSIWRNFLLRFVLKEITKGRGGGSENPRLNKYMDGPDISTLVVEFCIS